MRDYSRSCTPCLNLKYMRIYHFIHKALFFLWCEVSHLSENLCNVRQVSTGGSLEWCRSHNCLNFQAHRSMLFPQQLSPESFHRHLNWVQCPPKTGVLSLYHCSRWWSIPQTARQRMVSRCKDKHLRWWHYASRCSWGTAHDPLGMGWCCCSTYACKCPHSPWKWSLTLWLGCSRLWYCKTRDRSPQLG